MGRRCFRYFIFLQKHRYGKGGSVTDNLYIYKLHNYIIRQGQGPIDAKTSVA